MHPDLNRRIWENLENWIRSETIKRDAETHIVTGALFLPSQNESGEWIVSYKVLDKDHVAVPTHFFKAILFETAGEIQKIAFIIPNKPTEHLSFWNFQVTLDEAENKSGLLRFPLAHAVK